MVRRRCQIVEQEQSTQNTRNDSYGADDINNMWHWAEFNLATIQQQYGAGLAGARIADDPFQASPPRPINSETAVRSRIDAYLTNRVVPALRNGFAFMSSTQQLTSHTITNFDVGTMLQFLTPVFLQIPDRTVSRVNSYMKQHHARYSFVLTVLELVAVRRLDRDGNLQLSDSIPWTASGTTSQPPADRFTGDMVLGYARFP
ncbi:hypothetical protein AJ79_08828 [Helicocarpus griseus UAMH5409]|uniref:Uncharacterized protein n=1 Tax=Helicocarpus griseus UAMH5409 TaxID=1447875 RepID=A0A2B7WP76_9EURO|nr:hypothetical protein AJ79_08828 [Helicocarpus griseus UAMH5409]